ncbi:hypothetical protein BUALT_Bualt09G0139400 [Buddleja alternifolia]|uniref:PIN-like protein n=1 Tax=Buddleja alternifolia TaxID=168488 RepID=A0AAV6X3V4_9LAMI|nr:hypothetical protein BUALT_Bualt09G0139400 [Buddleja alternifolia]
MTSDLDDQLGSDATGLTQKTPGDNGVNIGTAKNNSINPLFDLPEDMHEDNQNERNPLLGNTGPDFKEQTGLTEYGSPFNFTRPPDYSKDEITSSDDESVKEVDMPQDVAHSSDWGHGDGVHADPTGSLANDVLTEPQKGGESLLGTIKIAVLPIVKVFTMCFLGLLMASKYVNILPANGRKLLNGLVFSLLLPCLIFSQLGQAISFEKMTEWWFIPINVILATISGSIIGFVVASIVRPPYPYFKFTIIQIGIGNIGNVPLVLIAALCRDKSNPFGNSNKCSQDGNAYISFGQWVGAILLYTYVFNMLAPPPGGTFDVEDGNLPVKSLTRSSSNLHEKDSTPAQVPLLTEEAIPTHSSSTKKEKTEATIYWYSEAIDPAKSQLESLTLQDEIIFWISQAEATSYSFLILAIFIGCVPFLKKLIFTADAPLYFFTDSCMILGFHSQGSNDPMHSVGFRRQPRGCPIIEMGAGPGSSKLGARTTAAIIFGRLVLVPPTGLGIVMLADKLGFLPPGDKMFRFVLLLQHTMPTSVLSGAVANLRGCGREAAAVLFWVHVFAIFSMAGWIILYLNILF